VSDPIPPPSCAVAFKEWAGVCSALMLGRQAIILRKGGIAEADGRFVPEHPWFWLYPTHVHQAQQGLFDDPAVAAADPPPPKGTIEFRALAGVVGLGQIGDIDKFLLLLDMHVWKKETLRQRFSYRSPGLWLMAVRVFSRPMPISIEEHPEFGGCTSWVPLKGPLTTEGLRPVMDETDFQSLLDRLGPLIQGNPQLEAADPLGGRRH
jgi:hypothetical protein